MFVFVYIWSSDTCNTQVPINGIHVHKQYLTIVNIENLSNPDTTKIQTICFHTRPFGFPEVYCNVLSCFKSQLSVHLRVFLIPSEMKLAKVQTTLAIIQAIVQATLAIVQAILEARLEIVFRIQVMALETLAAALDMHQEVLLVVVLRKPPL